MKYDPYNPNEDINIYQLALMPSEIVLKILKRYNLDNNKNAYKRLDDFYEAMIVELIVKNYAVLEKNCDLFARYFSENEEKELNADE